MILFFQRDYSVGYIARNSSDDLPFFYTFSAFWSALEGSHFLWTLLISIVTTVAIWTYAPINEHLMPMVSATFQAVLSWMYFLLISFSDPFLLQYPEPSNGAGLNALLQNPYMAIHPPCLFIGYTTLIIPFAYSMATLAYGDISAGWLKTVRRWTLFGWCFLTAAIILGGRWAYVELGWAGYWAWDPVENASFMPWIVMTAQLHVLIIQEKLGQLKRLSILLSILAFFLSFLGTFITRSGVVSSVHSFAESPIGPNYLIFISLIVTISLILYFFRANSIVPTNQKKVWGFSKESAMALGIFLFLALATIVFIGTLFPIFSEAIGKQKISVQAPYFNSFSPYIGLGIIIMVAIGNLMQFQSSFVPGAKKIILGAVILAFPLSYSFIYFGDVLSTDKNFVFIAQLIGMYLVSWSFLCLVGDFYLKCKSLRFQWSLLFRKNRSYLGAWTSHVGGLLAILGFLGNYRGITKEIILKPGDQTEFYGYQLTYKGINMVEKDNAMLVEAPLDVERDGKKLGEIIPTRSKYPTKPELMHEVGVIGNIWHDLYIVLSDFEKKHGGNVTLQMHINHTVRIVWISAFILVIGGIICFFDPYRGRKEIDLLS